MGLCPRASGYHTIRSLWEGLKASLQLLEDRSGEGGFFCFPAVVGGGVVFAVADEGFVVAVGGEVSFAEELGSLSRKAHRRAGQWKSDGEDLAEVTFDRAPTIFFHFPIA